jgi:large subunit ribosomal protein L28
MLTFPAGPIGCPSRTPTNDPGTRRDSAGSRSREVCESMAAVCEVCGKHPSFGMSISHSHRRTKRRWNPNIQRIRALVNGSPKRVSVCTSCIRAGKITKVVR